jgi:stearoyl-CoA desaturase (Delta-9 desaturase)
MERNDSRHLPNVVRFVILHLAGLFVFSVGYSHVALIAFVLFYLIRFSGVSIAYHRYFSHRSFKTSRLFQFLLGLLGTTSGQRGPLWWAAGHRKHHRFSDTPKDIHSPHHNSLWFSHLGWVLEKESLETDFSQVKDFDEFPEIHFLNKHNYLGVVLSYVFLYIIGENFGQQLNTSGAQLLIWGGILSTLLCCHSVLALNSVCHIFGKPAYDAGDKSTNVWWMSPLLLGEQLHNNHHQFPSSYTAAFTSYEVDVMGAFINILEKCRIVWELKRPSQKRALSLRINLPKDSQRKDNLLGNPFYTQS